MHAIPGITDLTSNIWPCLNNTANPPQDGPLCSLSEVCGFGGITGNPPDPDQVPPPNPSLSMLSLTRVKWYRVIVPIFLHGGIIHILFNLLIQLRLGADMEKVIGTIRFMLIYFPSGIMGFILGANFAGNGLASTGCSGALFGIIAVVILDLFYNWGQFEHPKRNLAIILVQVVICFVLGLLPGLDNFSHIGGFFTGLLLGVAIMRAPPKIRARLVDNKHSNVYELGGDTPYASLTGNGASSGRARGVVGYFQHRRKWWWIWNLLRGACLALVIIAMVLLFNNFYVNGGGHCSWCRYLRSVPRTLCL
jgi:membrane associated rhomboid family serine protease